MKNYLLLTLVCLFVYNAVAQKNTIDCGQVNICQNEFNVENVYDNSIIIEESYFDNNNNLYNVGKFSGTVDFNPDPNINADFTSNGSDDCFLQKLDENGQFIWTKTWGGENDDEALDVSIDSQGNIYVVGFFNGVVDFDPSMAVNFITSSQAIIYNYGGGYYGGHFGGYYGGIDYEPTNDGFILKLDGDGNFLWADKYGSAYTVYSYYNSYQFAAGYDVINDIEIDDNDNIIIAGSYDGYNDFDGNVLTSFDYSYGYAANASFIAKIDNSNGQAIWAYGINSGSVNDLKIDPFGNILLAQSVSIYDYFFSYISFVESNYEIRKFDSDGQFIWSYPTDEIAFSNIAIDSCANIFSVGDFGKIEDFNIDSSATLSLDPVNGDNFLLKLSESGSLEFASQHAAFGNFIDVDIDSDGNAYVAKNIDIANYQISKYDNSGNSIWTLDNNFNNFSNTYYLSNILLNKENEVIVSGRNSNRLYYSCTIEYNICNAQDWSALKALYLSTNGNNWKRNDGWNIVNADTPPVYCDLSKLFGVSVNDGFRVSEINLYNNNLNGPLPPEIGDLNELTALKLAAANLVGEIPNEIGKLNKLKYLYFTSSGLSGIIPSNLGELNNLTDLRLSNNQLTGEIPLEFTNLQKLDYLSLDNNQLSGAIPTQFANMSKIRWLSLSNNQLTGSIPRELSNLFGLRLLTLDYNDLSGCYPTELQNLCDQLVYNFFGEEDDISDGNSFDASWENFCDAAEGDCSNLKLADLNKFYLYPNPTTSHLFIEYDNFTELQRNINIYDVSGKKYFSQSYKTSGKVKLNIQHLPKGVYLVEVNSGLNSTTEKLIVK